MRFAELHLLRYGQFEDCRLAFPSAACDFHVIYGANEAGKSTTMAAVSDLLFGFPHSTAFDFRFDAKLLRVGAVLEAAGERFNCRRRKGLKNTLVDGNDSPVDEGRLRAMLHDQTREVFRLTSSLDHRRLREGGRALMEAKDDAGQAIFAAGSGMVGVKHALAALEAEADAIWGRRASQNRTYTRAQREHEAATRELRDAQIRPKDWLEAREAHHKAEAEQKELEARRRTASAALSQVERLRRVFEPIRRRAVLLERLSGEAVVAIPLLLESSAEEALKLMDDAERRKESAADLLQEARSRASAVVVDDALLAADARIEALLQTGAAVRKGLQDLTLREVELAVCQRKVVELASEIKLAVADDLSTSLPSQLTVAALRKLAGQHATDEVRWLAQREERETDELKLRDLNAKLAEAVPGEGLDLLESAVQAALRLGDVDKDVADHRRALARAVEARTTAFARLTPWQGSPEGLARLVPPSAEAINAAGALINSAAAEAEEARRRSLDLQEELAALERASATLTSAGRAVSAEQISEARGARDTGWSRVRDHLLGVRACDDPPSEATRFEALVQGADALSDRRFASAENSGRLSQMREDAAELRQQAEQVQQRKEVAEVTGREASQAWAEQLKAVDLPQLAPSELRAWLELRTGAIKAAETAASIEDQTSGLAERLDAARSQLRAALNETATAGEAERLAAVLQRAERKVTQLRHQSAAFAALKQEVASTVGRLADLARREDALSRKRAAWQVAWDRALLESGLTLDPQEADARLSVYETLRAEVNAAADLQGRISAIQKDAQVFQSDVVALAAEFGEPVEGRAASAIVEHLRSRLNEARAADQKRAALTNEVERHAKTLASATSELKAADVSLAEIRALTGAQDRASVAAAIDVSRRRRSLESDAAEAAREVARLGDGVPLADLVAACAEEEPDGLRLRSEGVQAELEGLSAQTTSAAERLAAARTRFEQLDPGPKAAQAASDAEQARAEMDAQAELYLLKRVQSLTLRWTMERFRERRQSPLLTRAGGLFETLTLGRYAGLTADLDGDRPRLLGLCNDRATLIEVDAMSEGTQDQLFLSLRLAALEQSGARLPFLADDLFVNFDDARARAGLKVLGELARSTQVLFFTHHAHLVEIAHEVFGTDAVSACELGAG